MTEHPRPETRPQAWSETRPPPTGPETRPETRPETIGTAPGTVGPGPEPRGPSPDNDVIELLLQQHREIHRLFGEVEGATGVRRVEAFDRLRRCLAVHETAEEEIVHPFARYAAADGAEVVEARLAEEKHAKQTLQRLERLDPALPEFAAALAELRAAVLAHSQREEDEEFPRIRANSTPQQLRGMAAAVRAAEAVAPTHPHPGVESPTANLLAGPLAAMIDRTRDRIRQTAGRHGG
ncbi:MAG TPA: hemerythrin domain-containing protein [Streptosporangiaceae bacterium]